VLRDTWQDCQGNEWIYESPATIKGTIQSGPTGKHECGSMIFPLPPDHPFGLLQWKWDDYMRGSFGLPYIEMFRAVSVDASNSWIMRLNTFIVPEFTDHNCLTIRHIPPTCCLAGPPLCQNHVRQKMQLSELSFRS